MLPNLCIDCTGTVAAMVELLLHIPMRIIHIDYELSSLASSDWAERQYHNIDVLVVQTVQKVTGIADPYDAAEQFVITRWGLTKENIQDLRDIFWMD